MTTKAIGRPRIGGNFHCTRCRQTSKKHRLTWPDGRICTPCYVRATETFGTCPQCDDTRMLPGRDESGQPLCRGCAHITTDLDCHRCGNEGELIRDKLCARCVLREDLDLLLSPNNPPDLRIKRLVATLCAVERPASIRTWIRGTKAKALLAAIGTRELALEHAALDALPNSRAVEHLRSLLVSHHMLPDRGDENLARFDRWVTKRLTDLAPLPRVAAALEPFARWHHSRRLHDDYDLIRNMNFATRAAKQEITEAGKLLCWLDTVHDVAFANAEQTHIDAYFADGPSTRKAARNFINWNRSIGATMLRSGRRRSVVSTPQSTDTERVHNIARLITEIDIPLNTRVIGLLMLLYGTPIGRLVQMRRDAITETPNGMHIDLGGTQPALIPEAISDIIYKLLTAPARTRTATIDAGWLFPSRRPGNHIHPDGVRTALITLGIPVLGGRNAALADLTQQLHPAVLADILGYTSKTLTNHAIRGGLAFASYLAMPREPR